MRLYYVEYCRPNGEWFRHSGHLPVPELDAIDQASRIVGSRGITEARLVSSTSGAVYMYVKLEQTRRTTWH